MTENADRCTWTEDYEGTWSTTCGHEIVFECPISEDSECRFCPYCGKLIVYLAFDLGKEESVEYE